MFKNNVFNVSVSTKKWMKAAGIRAVKTMAQSALAMMPAAAMITEIDWKVVAGTALLAGATSMLTSIVGIPEVQED